MLCYVIMLYKEYSEMKLTLIIVFFFPPLIAMDSSPSRLLERLVSEPRSRRGSIIVAPDCDKDTPELIKVATLGLSEKLKNLLEGGADPKVVGRNNRTALHVVSYKKMFGQVTMLEVLLGNGAEVDAKDDWERTALHWAARKGYCKAVETLLAHKADATIVDINDKTALHCAVKSGCAECVQQLTSFGLDRRDEEELTPLHYAVDQNSAPLVTLLLEAGALPGCKDKQSKTPLHRLAREKEGNYTEVMTLLISRGLSVDVLDDQQRTPLYCAASSGNVEVVRFLLEQHASLTLCTMLKETVLHAACKRDQELLKDSGSYRTHPQVVDLLIKAGAPPDEVDLQGKAPLLYAAETDWAEVVRLLLQANARSDREDNAQSKPSDYEVVTDMLDSISSQQEESNGWTVLHEAAQQGDLVQVQQLVRGAFLDQRHIDTGETALHVAAFNRHAAIVKVLLEAGASPEAATYEGELPHHYAVKEGHLEVVKTLLQGNEDLPHSLTKKQQTALHISAMHGHVAIAEYLLSLGANPNFVDLMNRTALHYASLEGHLDMVALLVTADNIAFDIEDVDGTTAAELARTADHPEVVQLLHAQKELLESRDGLTQKNYALGDFIRAAQTGDLEKVKTYVTHDPDWLRAVDETGMTALHWASSVGFSIGWHYRKEELEAHRKLNNIRRLSLVIYLLQDDHDCNVPDNHDCTPLFYAAHGGYEAIVRLLIKHNAEIEKANDLGMTPLQAACHAGHLPVVTLLIEQGASSYGLRFAVLANRLSVVKYLLTKQAPDNLEGIYRLFASAKCNNHHELLATLCAFYREHPLFAKMLSCENALGETLLHDAEYESLKFLYGYVPQLIDEGDADGRTALHWAVIMGKQKCVEFLLEKNARLTKQDEFGKTPLYYAVDSNFLDGVRLLLQAEVPRDTSNTDDKWTALHLACWRGYTDIVRLLLESNAFMRALDCLGRTPLHLAAGQGHIETVDLLLERGALHLAADDNGWTPLYHAAVRGHSDIVALLVKQKTSPMKSSQSPQASGWKPLHCASWYGHPEVVRILLENGAEVNAVTEDGFSPLQYALEQGDDEVVFRLLSAGAQASKVVEESPLYCALSKGHIEAARRILEMSNMLTADEKHNQLREALVKGNVKLVVRLLRSAKTTNSRTLIANDVDESPLPKSILLAKESLDLRITDEYKRNVMHWTVYWSQAEMIRLLHEKDDSLVSGKDSYGCTPLHYAALSGSMDCCMVLMSYGAEVTQDCFGRTVLHYSAMRGHVGLVLALLQKRPSLLDVTDNRGRTALHWASLLGYEEVVEELLNKNAQKDLIDSDGATAQQLAQSKEGVVLLKG